MNSYFTIKFSENTDNERLARYINNYLTSDSEKTLCVKSDTCLFDKLVCCIINMQDIIQFTLIYASAPYYSGIIILHSKGELTSYRFVYEAKEFMMYFYNLGNL